MIEDGDEQAVRVRSDLADSVRSSGWAVVRQVLGRAAIDALRAAVVELRATVAPSREILFTHVDPPPGSPGMDRLMEQWLNVHRRSPFTLDQAIPIVRRLASEVLGEDAVLFQDVLLVKRGDHAPFPWHQDCAYWTVDPPVGVVIWIALDTMSDANGGLSVATRSHLEPLGPAIDLHSGDPQTGSSGVVPELLDEVTPALVAGDAIVFDARTWHRSGRNVAGGERRAWSSSWLSPRARWAPERAPRHPLAGRLAAGEVVREGR